MRYLISLYILGLLVWSCTDSSIRYHSPEETLKIYHKGLEDSNIVAIESCFFDSTTKFNLPTKMSTSNRQIIMKRALSKKDAESDLSIPPSKAGDISIEVLDLTDSIRYFYLFRQNINSEWKIHKHYSDVEHEHFP